MQIAVITVGKLKEKYWKEALAEYTKRLSGYVNLDLHEVPDEPVPDTSSVADVERIVRAEGGRISKLLRDRDGIVALDLAGKALTSEAWAQEYGKLESAGYGRLVFVVGGSHGLSLDILQRAVLRWSFGPITLPHQLARVVLLEQLYRGIRILRGEPYHK